MSTPPNLYPQAAAFLAQRLLDAVCNSLEEQGVQVPTSRFVQPGLQAVVPVEGYAGDCVPGQVTVALAQLFQGLPGAPDSQPQSPTASVVTAVFSIDIWREVPGLGLQGQEPLTSATYDSAVNPTTGTLVDAVALFVALDQFRVNAPTSLIVTDDGMTISPVVPVGPIGRSAGSRGQIAIALPAVS